MRCWAAAMRDWTAYVRAHLKLPALTPEREAHIVRELAAQLEDFYREALARGASEAEADAHARAPTPIAAMPARAPNGSPPPSSTCHRRNEEFCSCLPTS